VTPAPDGGYPGHNTAEGEDALFSLTRGSGNRAIGFDALYRNYNGDNNTATVYRALYFNTTGRENTATNPTIPFKGRVLPGIMRQEWGGQV
jgi:hypothetical protein